ncbi:MAG: ribosome small subunit-dependent GTPase A, partial [Candidatus Thioglobus sp.]|nr:ribosome small subunit-dependent GTPase A [Candidatus Thioglobus sp.]
RFRNCLHINEPGCVVKDAVELGKISPNRYESYLNILP